MTLNHEARADFHAWQLFLYTFNGKCIFSDKKLIFSSVIKLFSDDSSEFGFVAVFGKNGSQVNGRYHFHLRI